MAVRFDSVAASLREEWEILRTQAVAGMGAIPASDLQDAYGYCWARWSQVLLDQVERGEAASGQVRAAASAWSETDRSAARSADHVAGGGDRGRR